MSTVSEIVAEELKGLGVEHFFLFTGGDHELWVAFEEHGIQQVLARSEDAAVYMADAYARVSHHPGFVYGQYGPGAGNVAGSLPEPLWAGSPVVAMASAMRRHHRHRLEYQELDQITLFLGVTKWQAEASVPSQIPHVIRAGVIHALEGTPGPVYVGIPNDLTGADYDGDDPARKTHGRTGSLTYPLFRPHPDPKDVEQALRILSEADRPLILAGKGVHASGAAKQLTQVARMLRLPVITSLSGKGSIPEDDLLAVGITGRYSHKYANQCLKEADVLLAVGSGLGGLVTDSYRLIGPQCRIVQVDLSPAAIGHNFDIELGIQADASTFLEALLECARDAGLQAAAAVSPIMESAWHRTIAERRSAWQKTFEELAASRVSPMAPEAMVRVMQEELPQDAVLLADTGYAAAWAGVLYQVRQPGQSFLRSDGSLGWAFPASLGAALASPARRVFTLIGDGGFGYHVGELETAVRLGLPVTVIVMNNGSLAFEHELMSRGVEIRSRGGTLPPLR
jgi:acetolactate synthase-1/2/3 large subunit